MPSVRSNRINPDVLLDQIAKLTHDLDSFDRLKKSLIDDELEISWDRQHISQLEDNLRAMKGGFEKMTKQFQEEERVLIEKNQRMNEALVKTSQLNANAKKLDHDVIAQLSNEISKVHSEWVEEHEENIALRKLLAEKLQEIQKQGISLPKEHLRGSPLKLNDN